MDNNTTEIIILRQALQGDHAAWQWLFDRHFEPTFHYCLSLTRGDDNSAEELTQEVFVTAAQRLHRFAPERASFRSWLLGIARKHLQKRTKQQARRWRRETAASTPASAVESHHHRWLHVYETLGLLPDHYRVVLEAKYIECLTVQEIATREDKTQKAVESLLSRARVQFRRLYRKADES